MHLDLSSAAVTGAVAMLESNKASENSADFEDCDVKNSIFVDSILHQYRCHFPDLSTYKLPENSSINLFALRSDQLIFDSLLWICLTILDCQLTRCSFLNIIQYRFFVHWTVCRLIGNNHHLIDIMCVFFSLGMTLAIVVGLLMKFITKLRFPSHASIVSNHLLGNLAKSNSYILLEKRLHIGTKPHLKGNETLVVRSLGFTRKKTTSEKNDFFGTVWSCLGWVAKKISATVLPSLIFIFWWRSSHSGQLMYQQTKI